MQIQMQNGLHFPSFCKEYICKYTSLTLTELNETLDTAVV